MADFRFPRGWLRKRLQLSVLGLMVLVLIAGTVLGLVVRKARVQRDAVLAITNTGGAGSAGGTVYYDWELPKGRSPPYIESMDPHSDPWAPKWLVDFLGVDYFGHVVYVELFPGGIHTTDELMAHVGRLTALQELDLRSTSVSNAGLKHLSALTRLRWLDLGSTAIGGDGMAYLGGLKRLETLSLAETSISDDSLVHLADMPALKRLSVLDTQIGDRGLAHLQGLVGLDDLNLSN